MTWSERHTFWAETARTAILGILGGLLALWIVRPWENILSQQAEVEKARLSTRAKIVDEFLTASYGYTSIAFDALNGDGDAVRDYQGKAYDSYRAALNSMTVYFPARLDEQLKRVDELNAKLRQLFKEKAAKDLWEPVRVDLKSANNALASAALRQLGIE